MPPVIANGGYYGAPGVTAAGAYGASPADMLYSLRNQGWSDQQIIDTYGANDPMVRIMQLESQYSQRQPNAGGYRYQYPAAQATTPARRPAARRPAAQAQSQQRAAAPQMSAQQQAQYEAAMQQPVAALPEIGSVAPSYQATADDYYAPLTNAGLRIRPWTDPITYGGSLNMPDASGVETDYLGDLGSFLRHGLAGSNRPQERAYPYNSLGRSVYGALQQQYPQFNW